MDSPLRLRPVQSHRHPPDKTVPHIRFVSVVAFATSRALSMKKSTFYWFARAAIRARRFDKQSERRTFYNNYINKSSQWQEKRVEAIAKAGYKCQRCGTPSSLQVHHLTYRNLGNEASRDLEVLCEFCHAITHGNLNRASTLNQWQETGEGQRAFLVAKTFFSRHPVLSILVVLWLFGSILKLFGAN